MKILIGFAMFFGVLMAWSQPSTGPIWVRQGLPQANQLLVDEEENLILLDSEQAVIYRLLSAYEYDSMLFIGGRSNRLEGFVHPIKLSLQNRQALYVLDDAQARLVVLNPNLRIVQSTEYLRDQLTVESSLFPVSFAVGPLGELFFINRSDNRVVKINSFGEEELRFGGGDYGPGALYDPVGIEVDEQNFVYVSDTTEQLVQVYDLYGVHRFRLQPDLNFRWKEVSLFRPWLIFHGPDQIAVLNLVSNEFLKLPFDWPKPIIDVFLRGDYFYVLGPSKVSAFRINR
ncbi:MAG: hypothetical protein AAF804_17620 [Bacteroidota bacterium]